MLSVTPVWEARMAKYLWWVLAGVLVATSAHASGGAFYLFNEHSGTVAIDSSGAGNNGTVNGAGYVPGYEGMALSFSKYAAVLVPRRSSRVLEILPRLPRGSTRLHIPLLRMDAMRLFFVSVPILMIGLSALLGKAS